MRATVGCAIALLSCFSGHAEAGRTHFGWLFGTELNPNRGVELENWIVDINQLDKPDRVKVHETHTWTGIVVAVSDHLQLAIDVQSAYADNHVDPPSTNLSMFGGDVRWRPQAADDTGPLKNLFRIGVQKLVQERAGIRGEVNIVSSYEVGRVFATLDLGVIDEHVPGTNVIECHSGAGVSVRVEHGLRLGGEVYGELTISGPDPGWMIVGPTVGLTSGRFWGAANFGVGVLGIRDAGRITLGVVL